MMISQCDSDGRGVEVNMTTSEFFRKVQDPKESHHYYYSREVDISEFEPVRDDIRPHDYLYLSQYVFSAVFW
jgi:hypothetical protein